MTRDDIISMALDAGISKQDAEQKLWWIERFAQLVTAAAFEHCAKLCEDNWHECGGQCANVIRYGNTKENT